MYYLCFNIPSVIIFNIQIMQDIIKILHIKCTDDIFVLNIFSSKMFPENNDTKKFTTV